MIEVTAKDTLIFNYAYITSHGLVSIGHTDENWYQVRFQHRYPNEDFVEVLGTYPTLEEAAISVSTGQVTEPAIDVALIDLQISPDLFDWDRHLAKIV